MSISIHAQDNIVTSCGGHGECNTPPVPPQPPCPDPNPVDSTNIRSDAPVDPNEIIGPDGWMAIAEGDTVRWVNASQSLPYTIYFENDPEQATAAAQVVTVRQKLHPLMNMADFRVGTFGFGNHVFPVEGAPLQYQTRLDLTEEMNLFVDVVAGIDITTNEAFWIFSSIDPATGVAPTETDRGFLAVNDETHAGEGYVTFSIKPNADLCHTGDTISAQASIVFDINDPIETNRWVNTIDAVPPVSTATVLTHAPGLTAPPSNLEGELDSIRVVFSGTDDTTGIAAYRLYYTENGSAFRLAGRYPAGDTAIIAKQPNTTYTFFSLAEDNVGNIEPVKDAPDTLFGNTAVQLLATVLPASAGSVTGTGSYPQGDTATLILHPAEGYHLVRWIEAGVPQGTDTLLSLVANQSRTLVAEMALLQYPLTVEAATGTTIEVTSRSQGSMTNGLSPITYSDTLSIHLAASPCYSDAAFFLNSQPISDDTTIVVHDSVHLTSTATAHIDTGYVYDTVCRNTAYTANGFNILSSATTTAGDFNFQFSTFNLNGCDSMAILRLHVKPSHTITFLANGGDGTMPPQQVCEDDEAVLNSSTFTREGFFFAGWATEATASTADYADGGIISLNADQTLYAVWSSNCVDRESNRMVTACDSYTWNDCTYTASGVYERTRSSALPGGCDSIYRLHLTVKKSTESLQQVIACHPYTWIDGQTYASDTTRHLSITNFAGCDSIVTLQLAIRDVMTVEESTTACESYTWRDTTYTASGDYLQTRTAALLEGCDSVLTLHLTVNHPSYGDTSVTACNSFTWYDSVYTESGDYVRTWTSALPGGCDSIVTLHLTLFYSFPLDVTANTWHAISSPMHNTAEGEETVDGVTGLVGEAVAYDLYYYGEGDATWFNYKADSFALQPAHGYIYRRSEATTLYFNGQPNGGGDDGITVPLSASSDNNSLRGFNLIGNPYPHAVSYNAPYYELRPTGSWYAHPTGTIDAAQGFLVHTETATTYTFADMLPAKGTMTSTPILTFTIAGRGHEDVAYAMFGEGTGLPKIAHLNADVPELSINGQAIAILDEATSEFPLSLRARPGDYTLTAHLSSPFSYIHLIDKVTGFDRDLLEDSTYSFTQSGSPSTADRFLVRLAPALPEGEGDIFAHIDGKTLVIEGEGPLRIYDMLGRLVLTREVATSLRIPLSDFHPGVYALQLGDKRQRIVIE